MGSVPPLLAFLLMTFSGWVHRRQLIVINVGSSVGRTLRKGLVPYGTSKAGLRHHSANFALELAEQKALRTFASSSSILEVWTPPCEMFVARGEGQNGSHCSQSRRTVLYPTGSRVDYERHGI